MDGMKVQAGRARASVYFIMVLFLASGCNGGGNEQPPPAPVSLTALTPDSATAGSAAIEISAAGAGFTTSSVVQWNGASLTTNYVSPTALTAIVPTTDLATADNIAVTVSDASSGGASSGVVYFTISTQTPPMITALAPSSMTAGGAAFQLVINGTNFDSSATVLWNGRPIPTAFDSSTQLTAQVTAVQIASAAEIPVTVVNNPSPGGTSNSSTFTVANAPPVPTLISLSPNSIPAYSGPFTLTITGTGSRRPRSYQSGTDFFNRPMFHRHRSRSRPLIFHMPAAPHSCLQSKTPLPAMSIRMPCPSP